MICLNINLLKCTQRLRLIFTLQEHKAVERYKHNLSFCDLFTVGIPFVEIVACKILCYLKSYKLEHFPVRNGGRKKCFSNLKQDFYILTINILQLYDLLLNKIKPFAISAEMNWERDLSRVIQSDEWRDMSITTNVMVIPSKYKLIILYIRGLIIPLRRLVHLNRKQRLICSKCETKRRGFYIWQYHNIQYF